MYPIPTFSQLHQIIVQEIRNQTGLSISPDSDASIRADGTASVVEGLYQHQHFIQRQLFVATADEPYLYLHAEELGLPRLGGTRASGTVMATANTGLTLTAGSKLTDGKGHYWNVVNDVALTANVPALINVSADQIGSAWNFNGDSLLWVSPIAGLNGTAGSVLIGGGSDQEELESWRFRLLERKQLGLSRDRSADLISIINGVVGVRHVYVYPKRRGLGSLDVAITAVGNPPTLPPSALLEAAQLALDEYAGFWADCRVYSPTEQLLNVTAVVSGAGADLTAIESVIRDYIAELSPAETFQPAVLTARIMSLANVTDVSLTPDANVVPGVDWMYTRWLRAGTVSVSAAP